MAELARPRLPRLPDDLRVGLGRVEQRERVEHRERGREGQGRQGEPGQRAAQLGAVVEHAQARGHQQRDEHRAGRVLRRGRRADGGARHRPLGPAPALVDDEARDERDRHRDERHDVVEGVLGVEDRQEGDGQHRGGHEPDAAVVEPRAGPEGERDAERPQERDDHAGREEGRLGVGRERPCQVPAPEVEDEQQEVREGRGVLVVARVQRAVEHRDRPRDEVLGLVGVVGEGQAVVEVPQPQRQRDEEDDGDPERRAAPGRAVAGRRARSPLRGPGLRWGRRAHTPPRSPTAWRQSCSR